jgi:exopolyphosphatase/guanosine-5'-triphosphate,3'-diphosphate pyrophosphatase
MVAAHSLKLGTILMSQSSRFGPVGVRERYLNENLRSTSEFLSTELDLSHVRTFVIAGPDAGIAAAQVGKELNENCATIPRAAFLEFAGRIQGYSVEDSARHFNISLAEAEGLVPALMVHRFLLERTGADQVAVPRLSIREGLLIDLAQGVDPSLQADFYSQIIASAVNLGRKYHYDEAHSRHVARFSMTLFDALLREHGMSRRERMMLETAAFLHDIGMFIKASGHQMHGQYIVAHSEIFGLHREELDIIANVIRYHRGEPPSATDIEYLALQREDRVLVLKMAALLRVADALDRGHSQRIGAVTVERKSETIVLRTGGNADLSLEHIGLEEKAGLFQEVFGYKVMLN